MSISEEIKRIGEVRKLLFTERGQTNADHIRSMTDGQLAAFIIRGAERDTFFVDDAIGGSCDGWLERDELLDWLKQPYKEE